jgi:hypothetical protein
MGKVVYLADVEIAHRQNGARMLGAGVVVGVAAWAFLIVLIWLVCLWLP